MVKLVQAGQCGALRGGFSRHRHSPALWPRQDSPSRAARQGVTLLGAPGPEGHSPGKQLNHLLYTVLTLRGKSLCAMKRWFLCCWASWRTHSPKSEPTQQERWCLLSLHLRVRQRRFWWGTSGKPILGQLGDRTFVLPHPKPSVSDSVNARGETLRLEHFFITVFSNYCCFVTEPRGDRIFHISFP